jgi:hypothetical protein
MRSTPHRHQSPPCRPSTRRHPQTRKPHPNTLLVATPPALTPFGPQWPINIRRRDTAAPAPPLTGQRSNSPPRKFIQVARPRQGSLTHNGSTVWGTIARRRVRGWRCRSQHPGLGCPLWTVVITRGKRRPAPRRGRSQWRSSRPRSHNCHCARLVVLTASRRTFSALSACRYAQPAITLLRRHLVIHLLCWVAVLPVSAHTAGVCMGTCHSVPRAPTNSQRSQRSGVERRRRQVARNPRPTEILPV